MCYWKHTASSDSRRNEIDASLYRLIRFFLFDKVQGNQLVFTYRQY